MFGHLMVNVLVGEAVLKEQCSGK